MFGADGYHGTARAAEVMLVALNLAKDKEDFVVMKDNLYLSV